MSFDLQRFYRELDASYDAHDLKATEAFLLDSQQKAITNPAITSGSEGCMSCSPSLTVNLNYVSVTSELGCFYRGVSRWQESIAAFEAAQAEMEQYYATDNPEYGVVLLNKAGAYRYMGDLTQALATFEKARVLLEKSELTPPATLAGLYNNIGLVHLDMNNPASAVALFTQAMILLGGMENHPVEYGTTCNNLAVAFQRLDQVREAMDAVDQAINVLSQLDSGNNCHYPAALNTRGMLLYQSGKPAEALEAFMLAAEKTLLIYGENVEYANACSNCAACCKALEATDQMQVWLQKEQNVLSRLKK